MARRLFLPVINFGPSFAGICLLQNFLQLLLYILMYQLFSFISDYRRYYRVICQHGGVEGFLSVSYHSWFCYCIATETGLSRDSSYRLLQLRGKNIYPSKYSLIPRALHLPGRLSCKTNNLMFYIGN